MVKKVKLLFAATLALALSSCVREDYDFDKISSSIDATSSVGLPIASGSFTLGKVLPASSDTSKYVYTDGDDLLHLVYKETLDSLSFSDYTNILKDMQGSASLPVPAVAGSNIDVSTSFTLDVNLKRNDQIIQKAILDGGLLSFNSNTNFSNSLLYTLQSNDILDANGNPLKRTFQYGTTLNLAGYTIKPSADRKISFTLRCSGSRYYTSNSDQISFSYGIGGIKIKELFGSLGQLSIALTNNSFPLDFSKMVNTIDGFDIANPDIRLIFKNQAGVAFSFSHGGVVAVRDGVEHSITGLPSPIGVKASNGGTYCSTAKINPNSNLVSVLSLFPQTLTFNGNLLANPDGAASVNHIRAIDKLYIAAHADLPLDVKLQNLAFRDTSSYDFNSIVEDAESVDLLKLQLQVQNGFPLDLDFNALIIDANGNVLDQVFEKPVAIRAASITGGKASTPNSVKVNALYDQKRIQKLKAGDRIVFVAKVNTAGSDVGSHVKITSSCKMDVKVVGFIQANLNNL